MARSNGVDNLSVAQLLDLQRRIEAAIVARKAEEARDVKEKMQALAEKIASQEWLDKVMAAIHRHWRNKNARKRARQGQPA